MCPRFSEAVAHAFPDRLTILLWDNRGAHTAQGLHGPAHVPYVRWPPDGPELSPMERGWRAVQEDLAWRQCPDGDAQQLEVGALVRASEATTLQALTGYAYLLDAMNALCLEESHMSRFLGSVLRR